MNGVELFGGGRGFDLSSLDAHGRIAHLLHDPTTVTQPIPLSLCYCGLSLDACVACVQHSRVLEVCEDQNSLGDLGTSPSPGGTSTAAGWTAGRIDSCSAGPRP